MRAESLRAEARSGYRRIGLRYVLVGPPETLLKLIVKLGAVIPPLAIDSLYSHRRLRAERQASVPASSGLNTGLGVYGFRTNENPLVSKP